MNTMKLFIRVKAFFSSFYTAGISLTPITGGGGGTSVLR